MTEEKDTFVEEVEGLMVEQVEYLEEQETSMALAKQAGKIQSPVITANQIVALLAKTPAKYTYTRPGKGGKDWTYVSGGYVKKTLNRIFGWNWSFEIIDKFKDEGEVMVQGRLTIRNNEGVIIIVKEDFGKKEILCTKGTDKALSIGNDYKSASTDCLKRCAFQLGLASDIYAPQEYRELENPQESIVFDRKVYEEAEKKLDGVKSLEELKTVWANFPAEVKTELTSFKNNIKKRYENT